MSEAGPADGCTIAIFARAPVPGQCKTRLIPRLGAEGAAALQELFIARALETTIAAALGPVELWCAPDNDHAFFRACADKYSVALQDQSGDDLGARMHHAFTQSQLPMLLPMPMHKSRK